MNFKRISFFLAGLNYVIKSALTRRELPFIGGIVINDRCNLKCRHCFVSNRNIPDLTYDEIRKGLNDLYGMGMRSLYVEGGEPFLWNDHSLILQDVIQLARGIGFRFITLYTNGTFPVETNADTVFVSLDGLKDEHDANRGKSYDRIISNIKNSSHKKIFINYTVTKKNRNNIENFCEEMAHIKNIKGTFFYLYTPYHGNDELFLSQGEKKNIIRRILDLKKRGYAILNSGSSLRSVYHDTWKRPNHLSYLYAENKIYPCCRAFGHDEICKHCGYLGFTEIYHITRLNPNAIFSALKYL